MTTLFVACTAIGFGMLLLGIVLGGVFDFDLDLDADVGDWVSVPVLGAFLGAFGLGGLVVSSLTDDAALPALAGGAVAGVALGWVAGRLTRAFMDMPTDAAPGSRDFMGQLGRVVTPVAGGRGEVMLRVGGTPQKLSATADVDIVLGAEVVVVEVLSPSAVRVMPVSELLEGPTP